ncbi:MAG TPA: BrnT family toxin [Ktedonobacterales bacterium]
MLKCSYNCVVTVGQTVRWIWDEQKNVSNKRKHHLSFETAALVFDDPLALSRRDPYPDEERWQTIGRIGPVTVFVVHTPPKLDPATSQETGRIISARRATAHERKAYEEGNF